MIPRPTVGKGNNHRREQGEVRMATDLSGDKIELKGGRGSYLLGLLFTTLGLLVTALMAFLPESSLEDFALTFISGACFTATGLIILTLVSDFPLIFSTAGIFFLLLSWRLRFLGSGVLMGVSVVFFILAVASHRRGRTARRLK